MSDTPRADALIARLRNRHAKSKDSALVYYMDATQELGIQCAEFERELATVTAERDAALAEVNEQTRVNGMGSEREARLLSERDAARRERDAAVRDAERLRAINEHGWFVIQDIEGEWQIKAPRRYGAPVLIAESMSLFHAIDLAREAMKAQNDA